MAIVSCCPFAHSQKEDENQKKKRGGRGEIDALQRFYCKLDSNNREGGFYVPKMCKSSCEYMHVYIYILDAVPTIQNKWLLIFRGCDCDCDCDRDQTKLELPAHMRSSND